MNRSIYWHYYFARRYSLQRFQLALQVFTSDFYQEHFDVHLKNILVKPEEGGNHSIWLDEREFQPMLRKIYRVVCRDSATFHRYQRMIKRTQSRFAQVARQTGRTAHPTISQTRLAELYSSFAHWLQEHHNKPIWIPFFSEPLLSAAAQQALQAALRRTRRNDEYDRWFSVVFSPEQANAITRQRWASLWVAIRRKGGQLKGSAYQQALQVLADQFGFIPCYDLIDAPWDAAHFREEVEQLVRKPLADLRRERRESQTAFPQRRRAFQQLLRELPLRQRERELLQMAHELVFVKDERDDYRRQGSYYGQPLLTEIGRRLGLNLREACYLTIEETKAFLREGRLPDLRQVRERMNGYLLLRKNGKPLVVASGEQMCQLLTQEFPATAQVRNQDSVQGTIGAQGKASGRVAIVRTKHDLRRVPVEAVMVAVTTSPDYVPAMRRCVAIVTDEGGITSHAAIVARELKIPCIVGTKIVTQMFRDGELVEVDAIKGIIRRV